DSANVADEKNRYLAAYQYRNASDVLIPFSNITAPYLLGIDGRIWFVFIARTERRDHVDQFYLCGRAFMFSDLQKWRSDVRPGIGKYQHKLRRAVDDRDALSPAIDPMHQDIKDFCTKHCSFFADVTVHRTGTTEIEVPNPSALPETAPKLPDDARKLARITSVLASQLFFFVKDLGHRHQ